VVGLAEPAAGAVAAGAELDVFPVATSVEVVRADDV
jgi:hypothetical protein